MANRARGKSAGKRASQPAALPRPGRRPTHPGLLAAVSACWLAAGIVELVVLEASWRFVPGIVFLGLGLLYLRAAALSVLRRNRPSGQ